MMKSKWSTQRFGEVNQIIRDLEIKNSIQTVIKIEISDKKYVNRMVELEMFKDYIFTHQFDGVWIIEKK